MFALGACATACALSLGEIKVRSPIGSAFEAVLPFTAGPDEVLSPQCVRGHQDAASANQHVPLLANVRFEIRQSATGGEIVIRTRTLVHEPAVRIRLTIDCSPQTLLVREYVALLDAPPTNPPGNVESAPAPVATAAPIAASTMAPGGRRAEPRMARRSSAASASDAGAALRSLPSLRLAPPGDRPVREAARPAAGKPAGARPAAGKSGPAYRLTLSQPSAADAGEPVNQPLKRSDELMSLVAPARTLGVGEADSLRAEARLRLSDNPFAETLQMQTRLLALEGGMGVLRKELGEIESARRAAEERARSLAAENRRLAAWFNGAALLVAFLLCAALAAFLFWRYRLASEQRGRHARSWPAMPADAATAPASDPEPDPAADADVSYQQWRAPPPPPVPDTYQRTIVLDRSGESGASVPARDERGATAAGSAMRGAFAALAMPAHVEAPTKSPSPVAVPAKPMPGAPASTKEAAPAAALPAAGQRTMTAGASAADEYLSETALRQESDGARVKARIPTVPEKILTGAQVSNALPFSGIEARALALADQAMVVDFPVDNSPAGMASGEDGDARARSARYFAEFERKLFPEIALGRVKLDDPRSIIGLARIYYQEDFDPGKAISFLEYALHRSSDPMRIHLALLEILRMERRVGEYAIVARTFRGQYPDSGTHWQLVAAYGRLLDPHEPTYEGDKVPGLDLDTPSNWLGSTLDMTKYVLGQKVADSVRELPAPAQARNA